MLLIDGWEIVLAEESAKDFGERAQFSQQLQRATAIRYAANPKAMHARQAVAKQRWDRYRLRATNALVRIVTEFIEEKSTADELENRALQWMEQWTVAAYRAGMRAAGVGDKDIPDEDVLWLDQQWMRQERQYLAQFVRQMKNGRISRAMARYRATLYSNSLDGVFYVALVSCFPDSGTSIRWILGHAEHCPDCLKLASKKYTPQTLPTTPRAGATRCRSNCKCRLDVVFTPSKSTFHMTTKAPVPKATSVRVHAGREAQFDDSVLEMIGIADDSVLWELVRD